MSPFFQLSPLLRRCALWGALPFVALCATALLAETPGKRPAAKPPISPSKPANLPVVSTGLSAKPSASIEKNGVVALSGPWQKEYTLTAGQTVEISVHLDTPSTLPPNGRVAVAWTLPQNSKAGWRKILHALDGDVYLVYRAPAAGKYLLSLKHVEDEPWSSETARWREKGSAPLLASLPQRTPWPAGTVAPVSVSVKPITLGEIAEQERLRTYVEMEPNDSPDMAQIIPLTGGEEVRTWEITGGADDVEFFDNGRVGKSGEDWFRLEYKDATPHLLTAQLSMPGQAVAARIRCYVPKDETEKGTAKRSLSPKVGAGDEGLDVTEYLNGQDQNERAHQQDEPHRANICRLLQPGKTYYLRVEANAPGYQLQLRTLKPAPYADPQMAVRQGMYTQIGQVDAWLTNRPRGASVERRIRDSGNLLGTQCMSCHTQSGVWGPAVPLAQGYRLENVQNYWHLINVMYECLRPTNVLKDAANNTSLAPLDLGDGPAGTRAAGFNIVNLERILKPGKLHSKQQARTANFVLQTGDPGGINAAGPGSNVGQVIVYEMAAEILKTAWESTNNPKYFRALEEKAQKVLAVKPTYTDDIALRLDFFGRVVPLKDYSAWAAKAVQQERASGITTKSAPDAAQKLLYLAKVQITEDEARLRAIQNTDGSWGFSPGSTPDNGKTWTRGTGESDPAPTALGITGLTSAGYGKTDPTVAKGVRALLAMQEPTGRWNKAAQTGFVTSAYALHALSRLYPATPTVLKREDYTPKPRESLIATLHRVQALALTGEPKFADLLLQAAKHESPLVRYWAMIGLGSIHTDAGAFVLMRALEDRAKLVRDAAQWGFRQTLLDDKGWGAAIFASAKGGDYMREGLMQALCMRADAVMPQAHVDWKWLGGMLDGAMNHDPHPAVRAWAAKAAWQWWVWNPPIRPAVNAAWITLLTRPESNALVENSNRYSSQALFIANGHKANGSRDHQYTELGKLFEALNAKLNAPGDNVTKTRLSRRLVGIGATYFSLSGGDGGPGQMGYVTSGSGEMMGKATLLYLKDAQTSKADLAALRLGLEGGANVPYQPLTDYLVNYSLNGPEELRQLAASAISDPRSVSLAAVPELVEPQLAQIVRGALEPPRREQVSDPILSLWAKVNWVIPKTNEQQRSFFNLILPKLNQYQSPQEIAALSDPAKRAEAERAMSANWYLADRMGEVLQSNPDLHLEIVLRSYFPEKFANPLQERYWVRSVEWILPFNIEPPKAGAEAINPANLQPGQHAPPPDPLLSVKDRALQLYLDQLKPTADPRTRALAIRMANQTALRTNPEVLRTLEAAQQGETDPELRKIITGALKSSNEKFLPELLAALKTEKHSSVPLDAKGEPAPTKAQIADLVYFRDYVLPELTRQKRTDQMACMGCHGVPGRVPSMQLKPPDKFGYMPVADMLADYRTLQQRVNLGDMDHSKLLRKPLNVQDGKEDGHQGGRRYGPTDEGYLILKRWAESQPEVQKGK